MMSDNIGILHPGAMGISVAASAKAGGNQVFWVSAGRSLASRERAEAHQLMDALSMKRLAGLCQTIISVCPPHAAEEVAADVIAAGFRGLYVDGNAIAPQRAQRIGAMLEEAGISFVDGGIIGGPAWEAGRTWLYLSGDRAEEVAPIFEKGPLETEILGQNIGDASALKMCFAAYTKGSTALLSGIVATSEALGVREALFRQWSRRGSDFADQSEERVRSVTAKAWRFAGEMEEIAATFEGAGLPDGFHLAAREIYRRMADFKDAQETPSLAAVIAALLEGDGSANS
jgi:3-hydroxyisobutyrate dehydrogenase-like beta-hydroxyacid dehydrogenase